MHALLPKLKLFSFSQKCQILTIIFERYPGIHFLQTSPFEVTMTASLERDQARAFREVSCLGFNGLAMCSQSGRGSSTGSLVGVK